MAAELRDLLHRISRDSVSYAWAQNMLAEVNRAAQTGELSQDLTETQEFQSSLDSLRARQVKNLIALSFHKELHMTEIDYADSLPQFVSDPTVDMGRFRSPIIIDPRVTWQRQIELFSDAEPRLRRIYYEDDTDYTSLTDATLQPTEPYMMWTRNAGQMSFARAQKENFIDGEEPLTLSEVVGIYAAENAGYSPLAAGATTFPDGSIARLFNDGGLLGVQPLDPSERGGIYTCVPSRWNQVTLTSK